MTRSLHSPQQRTTDDSRRRRERPSASCRFPRPQFPSQLSLAGLGVRVLEKSWDLHGPKGEDSPMLNFPKTDETTNGHGHEQQHAFPRLRAELKTNDALASTAKPGCCCLPRSLAIPVNTSANPISTKGLHRLSCRTEWAAEEHGGCEIPPKRRIFLWRRRQVHRMCE